MAHSADFLASLSEGRRLWLRGLGRSMSPLLRSGDALEVERCQGAALRRGEIAVLRAPGGRLLAHLVVETSPLRTSTFLGLADPLGFEPLGRVVSVRRNARSFPLPTRLPAMLWWLHWATATASSSAPARELRGWMGALSRTLPARRVRRELLAPFRVTALRGAEEEAGAVLAAAHGHHPAPVDVSAWLGGYDRRGRLQAVAWLHGAQLRGLVVEPVARRLGLGRQLLEAAQGMALRAGHRALVLPAVEGMGARFFEACGVRP